MVFVQSLQRNACTLLSRSRLNKRYQTGGPRIKRRAQHIKSWPDFFIEITDPRRAQGRHHSIKVVLSIATVAILCGMRGYCGISDWAKALNPKASARFGCRFQNKKYIVPSKSIIRDVLIRVDPVELDHALN
jgi:hypothetical protein